MQPYATSQQGHACGERRGDNGRHDLGKAVRKGGHTIQQKEARRETRGDKGTTPRRTP